MYTIRHYKKDFPNLTVAIVGDILHSRVARSDIHALNTSAPARCAPSARKRCCRRRWKNGVRVFHDMR